jgi:hypothetical protein
MSVGSESVLTLVLPVSAASGSDSGPSGSSGLSAGVAAVVDRIEQACRAGGRFAVLIDARTAGDHGEDMDARDRRALVGRLRALRGELKQRCAGVVFLTGPAAGDRGRRLRVAGLLFGCPVQTSGSFEAARDWLAARGATVPDVPEGIDP